MSEKLKPCPFCGGEPELKQSSRNGLTVKCTVCGVKLEQKVFRYSLDWLKEEITKFWNQRTQAMSDITKCMNEECPLRHKCYRAQAKPHEYRQSHAMFEIDENGKCVHYWPMEDRDEQK